MLVPISTEIAVGAEETLIRFEGDRGLVEPVILMNSDSHEGAQPSIQGHSIGWWEEEALVIDTTHFAPHINDNGGRLPAGPEGAGHPLRH